VSAHGCSTRRPGSAAAGCRGRVPPHDLQAEESLLGAMMLSAEPSPRPPASSRRLTSTSPPTATSTTRSTRSTRRASRSTRSPSATSYDGRTCSGPRGPAVLAQIMASTPATTNAGRYAGSSRSTPCCGGSSGGRRDRRAGLLGARGRGQGPRPAESMVYEVNERRVTDSTQRLSDLLSDNLDRLEQLYEKATRSPACPRATSTWTSSCRVAEELAGRGGRPSGHGKCVAWDTPIVDPRSGAGAHRRRPAPRRRPG